jgi:beta-glucosidase
MGDKLTIDELITPLAGADWWNITGSGDVPSLKVTDGPGGARGELFAGGPPSVCFPCGAALGATWDPALVERVGAALAEETRAKGAQVLLAPTINLHRSPLGGRHFECMSEDPMLTAAVGSAYVRGLQGGGVAACVKHWVCNDVEHDRFEISSDPDDRTLREVSMLPFEHLLRGAGAWSAMSAYNRIRGTHAAQNEPLFRVLREEWGWDGTVISDWFGNRSAAPSALAGLDIEMPGPPLHFGAALAEAVFTGEVPTEVIEAKRDRIRLLARRTRADEIPPRPDGAGGSGTAVDAARAAAIAAAVLLRNEGGVLPFGPDVSSVAVIGPNADREVIQGGGSARVTPTDVSTVADGVRSRFATVAVEEGCDASRGTPALDGRHLRRADGTAGVDVEIVDAAGEVQLALRPREFRLIFFASPAPGESTEGWSLRGTATYTPTRTGEHRFSIRTNAQGRLLVDGREVATSDVPGSVELVAGEPVELRVEGATPSDPAMRVSLELRCAPPEFDDDFERAVAAAAAADAAVVVVGLDGEWETEGRDRDDLSLPGRQVELVRAVAAAQPRTVAVVLAGAPVDLSWTDDVPAVLWAWYPGQEGGHAIADVLTGAADPGGRLPCTMPRRIEDTPAFLDVPPDPGHLRYQEGVFCGHRWYDARLVEPAFPFGHGLSYTSFAIGEPTVVGGAAFDPGTTVTVDVPVTNTGDRTGTEVVQVYVEDPVASVRRPPRELKAFAKVALEPGESTTVRLALPPRAFAFWDAAGEQWKAEAGEFVLHVGRSSRDLAQAATVTLGGDWTAPASAPLS